MKNFADHFKSIIGVMRLKELRMFLEFLKYFHFYLFIFYFFAVLIDETSIAINSLHSCLNLSKSSIARYSVSKRSINQYSVSLASLRETVSLFIKSDLLAANSASLINAPITLISQRAL